MLETQNEKPPLINETEVLSPKEYEHQTDQGIEFTVDVTSNFRDVDSGWAWVVLAACFLLMVLQGAVMSAVGVIHIYLLEAFEEDETKTAWVGSIFIGLQCLMGPVASLVSRRWSCRTSMFIGGLMSASSMAASSVTTSLWMFFLTYSILAGMGMGMFLSPAFAAVGYSFEVYRSVTSSICTLGVTIGIMGGPYVLTTLEKVYGWRGSILLFAGFLLNVCVLASIQRPSIGKSQKHMKFPSKACSLPVCSDCNKCTCVNPNTLLCNRAFICLAIAFMLSNFGMSIIYVHLPKYVLDRGATLAEMQSTYITMAVGGMVSKLLTGIGSGNIPGRTSLNKMCLLFGAYSIAGTCLIVLPSVSHSQAGRLVCFCLVSVYYNVEPPLYVPLSLEIVRLKDLNQALGFGLFTIGVGFMAGPPFAAWAKQISQDYKYSFYLAGFSFLLGSLFCLLCVWCHKKEKNDENHRCKRPGQQSDMPLNVM